MILILFLGATPGWAQNSELTIEGAAGSEKPVGAITPALKNELVLGGSRGETLNFTLRVKGLKSCAPFGFSPWKSDANQGALEPKLYTMATMDIQHQSFPNAAQGKLFDPLIPVAGSSLCPADGSGSAWFWGELDVPARTKAGEYRALLRVGTASLPVRLAVWKMTMPAVPTLPAYSELSSWYLLLGHYGAWHPGEEALLRKYALEMKRHRIFPVKSFIAKPPFISHGDRPSLDLTNAPAPDQSFKQATLADRPKEIYFDFPTIPAEDVAKPDTVAYFKAIESSLASLHRPGKAMVYLWDEPKPDEMAAMLKLAKIARQNAPDLKILVTTTPKPELNPYVDIYVPVMDQFDIPGFPDAAEYQRLQKEGKEVWWYVSCMSHGCDALMDSGRPDMVIERPSAWIRSIAWLSERFGINAFLYYAVVNGYGESPKRDPWDNLWDFSGNGDGTLFYPARPGEHGAKDHGPIASIRLKVWREASFDAEYIAWMQELGTKQPDWWPREFAALTKSTTQWEHDYAKYQMLRDRVGAFLNSR